MIFCYDSAKVQIISDFTKSFFLFYLQGNVFLCSSVKQEGVSKVVSWRK